MWRNFTFSGLCQLSYRFHEEYSSLEHATLLTKDRKRILIFGWKEEWAKGKKKQMKLRHPFYEFKRFFYFQIFSNFLRGTFLDKIRMSDASISC